jgi:hypothetical protein
MLIFIGCYVIELIPWNLLLSPSGYRLPGVCMNLLFLDKSFHCAIESRYCIVGDIVCLVMCIARKHA